MTVLLPVHMGHPRWERARLQDPQIHAASSRSEPQKRLECEDNPRSPVKEEVEPVDRPGQVPFREHDHLFHYMRRAERGKAKREGDYDQGTPWNPFKKSHSVHLVVTSTMVSSYTPL